jgi:transposase
MQGQQQYQHQLFHYFDIESFIPQNHLLRKINKCIDLSFVSELTEPFYCQNNGRPSIAPELFFRTILIGYLYGIESDRQLCDEIQYNLAYRWFCKLNLEDKVLDHSSLTRIRDRFGVNTFNEFFIKIVEQCRKIGLVKGERIMTDGTLFQANASLDSLIPKDEIKEEHKNISKRGLEAPPSRKVSNKTHISKTDPDASLAFKNGTPRTLKYKAYMTIDADSRVVLDTKITKEPLTNLRYIYNKSKQ